MTNRQTDKHMDIFTYQMNLPWVPILWKLFKKIILQQYSAVTGLQVAL